MGQNASLKRESPDPPSTIRNNRAERGAGNGQNVALEQQSREENTVFSRKTMAAADNDDNTVSDDDGKAEDETFGQPSTSDIFDKAREKVNKFIFSASRTRGLDIKKFNAAVKCLEVMRNKDASSEGLYIRLIEACIGKGHTLVALQSIEKLEAFGFRAPAKLLQRFYQLDVMDTLRTELAISSKTFFA